MLNVDGYFCGAGGLEAAFKDAAAHLNIPCRIRLGVNHWDKAIACFAKSHPEADVRCLDVREFDPTQWGRSDIGLLGPSCEKFSRGKGVKMDEFTETAIQLSLWEAEEISLTQKREQWEKLSEKQKAKARLDAEYSRLSMFQVVRLLNYHRWNLCFVENVCDALAWIHYPAWLREIEKLGYRVQPVLWNSQFAQPLGTSPDQLIPGIVSQSRNRVIWVISSLKLPAPNLQFNRAAYCPKCDRIVEGKQTWKKGHMRRGINDYGPQWYYACVRCLTSVKPPITPAYNVIDWSLTCPTVGDRKDPVFRRRHNCKELKTPTRNRIGAGLKKWAKPALIGTDHSQNHTGKSWSIEGAAPTQTTRQTLALSVPPYLVEMYGKSTARELDQPCSTLTTSGSKHAVVMPPGFIHSYYSRQDTSTGLDEPVPTLTTEPRHSLVIAPFLTPYYGNSSSRGINEPIGTLTTKERHAIAMPQWKCEHDLDDPRQLEEAIDECGFRMLSIPELRSIQGFSDRIVTQGSQKEQARLIGQAVPPPSAAEIIARALQILT